MFFVFQLHCLWIYLTPYASTSVLRELYCYDFLHLGVSKQFWRRCQGAVAYSKAIFLEQSITSGNSSIGNFVPFFPYFVFIFYFLFLFYFILFYCAFIVAWALVLETREADYKFLKLTLVIFLTHHHLHLLRQSWWWNT